MQRRLHRTRALTCGGERYAPAYSPGIATFSKYELLERLAMGGMAEVHLARELSGDRRLVALKQILPHLVEDPAFMTMFLDEARIAARLHHPNVVEIYDLGRENDALFIAMEYVRGEDLRRIEKRCAELSRPFPSRLACRIVCEACKGLDYAHKRTDAQGRPLGIVHRDVSPQNLLVSFEGVVKVADFGVAKAADKVSVTASGIIKGKHPYMSPEQALGQEELDCRTDVFALGTVLYEAVTGLRLFRRATDLQTLKAVADCEVVPPSKVLAGLPPQLDELVLRALAKDRELRFQSAAELGAALETYASADAEATAVHVGRFVSELFADRLQREAKSRRFMPAFGVRGTELASPALAVSSAAKTIEVGMSGPVPLPPGAVQAPTQPEHAFVPASSRADVATKESRPPHLHRALPQTVTATAREDDPDAPDEQSTLINLEHSQKTLVPDDRPGSALPRLLLIVGVAVVGAGGWFLASRLDPRRNPPRALTCAAPLAVEVSDGQRWVASPYPVGTALRLFSASRDGTLLGTAVVAQTTGGKARIVADALGALPADLFVCPP